jgi:hypothetical protein
VVQDRERQEKEHISNAAVAKDGCEKEQEGRLCETKEKASDEDSKT